MNHPNDFIQEEINDHDRELVKKANELGWRDWMLVHEELAQTVEGFNLLHRRASYLYHKEEAMNGEL